MHTRVVGARYKAERLSCVTGVVGVRAYYKASGVSCKTGVVGEAMARF